MSAILAVTYAALTVFVVAALIVHEQAPDSDPSMRWADRVLLIALAATFAYGAVAFV